jgi:hypothetical protein
MSSAVTARKHRREYQKHGDIYRQRLLKERGVDAINGRTRDGKKAKAWRAYALAKKGGKSCPIDVREKIEAGTFSLWRALCLRSYIAADARRRGTPNQQALRQASNDQRAVRHGNEPMAADQR